MKKFEIMKRIKKSPSAMFKIAAIALIAMPILSSCEKGEKPINGGEENLIISDKDKQLMSFKDYTEKIK